MWTAFVGAVLLSTLLGRSREEKGEEEKKKAVGLEPQQLDLFSQSLVDWMVPVRMWLDDGASLWRIIGRGMLEQVETSLKRTLESEWASRSDILKDLDPSSWSDEESETSGGNYDVYVYVEGEDKEHQPSALMLVDNQQREPQPVVTDPHGVGLPKGSRAPDRLFAFAEEHGWDVHPIRELWGNEGTIPDKAVEILERMRAALEKGKDGTEIYERLLASSDRKLRDIGVWARDFSNLWWGLQSHNGLAADRKSWERARPDDEEVLERIREEDGGEEIVRKILSDHPPEDLDEDDFRSSRDWGEDAFDRFVRRKVEDLVEEMNEGEKELLELVDEEKLATDQLVNQMNLRTKSLFEYRRIWELQMPWDGRDDESVDDLYVRQDDEGKISYDFQHTSADKAVGVLDSLVKSKHVEAESERLKRVGPVIWNFPGDYKDVWEIWAMMGTCRPNGTEPLLLFLKIALDHGLLSDPAKIRYADLLQTWEDPMTKMVEHGLIK